MIHAVHPLSTIPLCHLAYAPILHTNSPVSSPYISLQISWENFEKLMIKAFLLRWSCHSHNLFSLNVSHGPTYMQKLQKKKFLFFFPELKQSNFPANGTMNLLQSQCWVENARQYFENPKAWEKKFWAANYKKFLQYSQRFLFFNSKAFTQVLCKMFLSFPLL